MMRRKLGVKLLFFLTDNLVRVDVDCGFGMTVCSVYDTLKLKPSNRYYYYLLGSCLDGPQAVPHP